MKIRMLKQRIKKILYVCSVYKPNIGGIETTIEELSKYYNSLGIETVVLTKRYPFNLKEKETINDSFVIRIKRPQGNKEYLRSINFLKTNNSLLKADVVHLIGVRRPMPLYGLLLSRYWQVPYIVTFTGGDIPDPEELPSIQLWKEGLDVVPQSIIQADELTTFSNHTKNLAKKAVGNLSKIDVIYAGINIQKIRKIKEHKEKWNYFFAARRLDHSKGIDMLIEAYFMIKDSLSNTKLVIAGEGYDKVKLIELTKKFNLQNDVLFLGDLDCSKVISYMKGALAHICPSRTEGGGIVNFEAQASGCVAIGSNAGGIPEYIKNSKTGLIFPRGNSRSLSQLLLEVYRNKKLRSRITTLAMRKMRKNTWEKFSKIYLNLYNILSKNYNIKPFHAWSQLTEEMWSELKNG